MVPRAEPSRGNGSLAGVPEPTTLVLRETTAESGKFALKIKAVPFGTATPEAGEDRTEYDTPMVDAMDDDGNPLPMFPVKERDIITMSGAGSTGTLVIETTAPSFTSPSPAHNSASDDSRPEVSMQVTDSDSGLDGKDIDILFLIEEEGSTPTYKKINPDTDGDVDAISGGFEIRGRLNGRDAPDGDATIYWWIRATDKTGNVGYSDQSPTNDDGTPDACGVMGGFGTDVEAEVRALDADAKCDPYAVLVDDTAPKLLRAETGRHWSPTLQTGDSKDKTEYRVNEADKSSVLVVFDSHLDATSVSASDFEVNGSTPADASVYNVKVRDDAPSGDKPTLPDDPTDAQRAAHEADLETYNMSFDGNSAVAGDSVEDVGERLGYVFLRLSADLSANAEPKVELVGDALDLAGNEQDTGVDNDALDRIAPTLTVTIDEGSRPATMDKVNLTITSDEAIGTPKVEFVNVVSYDGTTMASDNAANSGMGAVKFVSSTEYSAVVSPGGAADGLYTVFVEATDASGGNMGVTGVKSGEVDVSGDSKLILFEYDTTEPDMDINPGDGPNDEFSTDDMNAYIRIDFSAEDYEYDIAMYDDPSDMSDDPAQIMGDDLDTHHGVTIVSATLNGDDISGSLQPNDAGNVFLYRAPEGLAVGEHELAVVAEDEAGNRHAVAQTATITITEREPFSLKLNPGWNLISIPGEPADPDINAVIPADRTDITSVLAFDPAVPGMWLSASRGADGMFSGTLKSVVASRGYWVETTSFTPLPVMIPKAGPGTGSGTADDPAGGGLEYGSDTGRRWRLQARRRQRQDAGCRRLDGDSSDQGLPGRPGRRSRLHVQHRHQPVEPGGRGSAGQGLLGVRLRGGDNRAVAS